MNQRKFFKVVIELFNLYNDLFKNQNFIHWFVKKFTQDFQIFLSQKITILKDSTITLITFFIFRLKVILRTALAVKINSQEKNMKKEIISLCEKTSDEEFSRADFKLLTTLPCYY